MHEELVQCDCCDFYTISKNCDYEICPICFWEQDAFGISEPEAYSGANHGLTLLEGRHNFRDFGACSKRFISKVIIASEHNKFFYQARVI